MCIYKGQSLFQIVLTVLVTIWGLRLGLFLLMRYVVSVSHDRYMNNR
jgi:steroid 5-alpha reductase family enzyme